MKKYLLAIILFSISSFAWANKWSSVFVYLRDVDPSIQQEIRYYGYHNFIGHPIAGYAGAECLLTQKAAVALSKVQAQLIKSGYSLKVYDCYRPQKAVDEFIAWSKETDQQQMKVEFYPRVDKADFFKLGYVAEKSGHTRGSTLDLTIVPISAPQQIPYQAGEKLVSCFAPLGKRFPDNSIEMGTGYDCMDELAHGDNQKVSELAYQNRLLLRSVMMENGFLPYAEEWWHFTLKNEPYPDTYFDFDIPERTAFISADLTDSQQLLLVQTKSAHTQKGKLQRYQRNSDKQSWQKIGAPIAVVIGKYGMASVGDLQQSNLPVKKEGDLRTPTGVFKISHAFGFAKKPENLQLSYLQLNPDTVCVDDPSSNYYNQIVDQTKISNRDWQSSEKMRAINAYKIGAVIAYNQTSPVKNKGSCIFLHVWQNAKTGTAGCVAMPEQHLKQVLTWLNPNKNPVIKLQVIK
jgi:D-alanyl-D-alanine dipeptidase